MGFPDRVRAGHAQLAVELLEDRTTPSQLDGLASLPLPELVSTGAAASDRVNVVMRAETSSAADASALAATPFAASVKSLGFGIYSVSLAPGTDIGAALAYYNGLSGVQSAAPDEIVRLQLNPNDPSFGSLYGMQKIGAPTAWNTSTGTSSFVVAVIDSGVDYNHPDLAANMWRNPSEVAGDGIDNDGNGLVDDYFGADFANNDGNPMDDNNHGTHVAGTIGAVGNNGVGVVGVNWNVKIMALKFLSASGSGAISGAISCLDYAVSHGAKLSNNSWGGGGYSSTMAAAIGRAQSAGHIFVAAAGNNGQNNDVTAFYPASYIQSYNNVVTVAATDSNDALASFSNYGASSVTLAAPGVGILSTTPNNTYSSFSGTSMASPHVTGAIALYWGANPTLSYTQVIDKLKTSVDVLSNLSGVVATGGRLNVAKMFTSGPAPTLGPKVVTAVYSGAVTTQFDKVRVTFDKDIDASSFTIDDIVSFNGPNGAITGANFVVAPVTGSTTQFDITFTPQTATGTYSLTFGPNIADAGGKLMDQNGNGTGGEATLDRFTATGSLVQNVNRTYSASGLPLAIKDNSTTTSTIVVTESVKITDLNVKVSINHTYDGDLVITLTSPAGKTVTLFNRRGGSGDNLTGTTFDDEATIGIASGTAPFSGTYRIEVGTGNLLSAFDGASTQGTWTLKVSDKSTRDTGSLTAWSLVVNGTIGSGAGLSYAQGFLDEPTFAHESGGAFADHHFDAAPLVVTTSEPARPTGSAPFAVLGADRPALWLSSRGEGRAFVTQSEEGRSYAAARRASGSESGDHGGFDFDRERRGTAVAELYFPPEASDSDTGDFSGGALDAE